MIKYTDDLFGECKFPNLQSPYKEALEDAVKFILKKFSVQGIIVTGSIISGRPSKSSDLDIHVINNRYERQRIQRFFNNVPTEIFVNPVHKVKEYLEEEFISGKASTASMYVNGFVILDQNQNVFKIRSKSKEILSRSPSTNSFILQNIRYQAADTYENGTDVIETDIPMALSLISEAVRLAIHYKFRKEGKWIPRHKDLFIELDKLDSNLSRIAKDFYLNPDIQQKFKIAEQIMDLTIKTRGFFEWDSDTEIYKEK